MKIKLLVALLCCLGLGGCRLDAYVQPGVVLDVYATQKVTFVGNQNIPDTNMTLFSRTCRITTGGKLTAIESVRHGMLFRYDGKGEQPPENTELTPPFDKQQCPADQLVYLDEWNGYVAKELHSHYYRLRQAAKSASKQ
jgi:hypothetical protein